MNTPPEQSAPHAKRGFFTRKRLLLLLVFALATSLVLLIVNLEHDGQQSSRASVWETLRHPAQWPKKLQAYYKRECYRVDPG